MERLRASSQYGDLKGTAAADYRFNVDLKDLGKKHGFDAEKWEPIALSLLRFEDGDAMASIIAVSKADYPGDHDSLVSKMEEVGWRPRMTKFNFSVAPDEALWIFKSVEVVLIERGLEKIEFYEADDSVYLDDK